MTRASFPDRIEFEFKLLSLFFGERMTIFDWTLCRAVERTPQKVSGEWVFRDTRVPVKALFENLEDGASVDDFVEWFPGVRREQVVAVLAFAQQTLDST